MNNRNKNNRIIFLTTLSVYLGLVLVGGAMPNVLAQAATTRNFNVQDEIEVKDDLDNKPDGENSSRSDFPFLLIQLLNEIKREALSGKITLPLPNDFVVEGHFESFSGLGGGGAVGGALSDKRLEEILRNAISQSFQRKAFELADFGEDNTKSVRITLAADQTDLMLKVSFSKNKADKFADFLNQKFSSVKISAKNKLAKQVYDNTSAETSGTAENNQVYIVTRLPRGSLDEFLKQNAKADNQ